jgi:membrane associated rhomboid family serine protease
MGSTVAAACYAVVLGTAVLGVGRVDDRRRRPPLATCCALLVIGTMSLLQLTAFPALLAALQRDPTGLAHGQLWRLGTSLTVQDGGWPGTVFNLTILAVVGVTAESLWSRPRWWLIALTAGIGAQFWGLVVQPSGAGNSVLVFGLAASLHVLALRYGAKPSRVLAVLGLGTAVALLVGRDVHGGAALIGAVVSAVLLRRGGAAS